MLVLFWDAIWGAVGGAGDGVGAFCKIDGRVLFWGADRGAGVQSSAYLSLSGVYANVSYAFIVVVNTFFFGGGAGQWLEGSADPRGWC